MSTLIISYKTHDQPSVASSLFSQLSSQLADTKVIGVSTILNNNIVSEINGARALLVVIGANWAQGGWLNNPQDDDTIAIQTALSNPNVSVVPIYVDNASLPSDLPAAFNELKNMPNFQISSANTTAGSQQIVSALQSAKPRTVSSTPSASSGFNNPYQQQAQTTYQQPNQSPYFQQPQPPSSVMITPPQQVYVQQQSTGGNSMIGCLVAIVEFAAGWFGFLGIGHMITGNFGTGCMTMLSFWIYIAVSAVVIALTGGLGLVICGPLTLIILFGSAFSAYSNAMK